MMHAGEVITASTNLYIYTESGERINCTDENIFSITIYNTPHLATMPDQRACTSYVLPALSAGDYYTGSLKTGTHLNAGDVITTSQTIYIYAESGTPTNCYTEVDFDVTIFSVDDLPAVTTCENYVLPALSIGNYYTGPNGTGTHLHAGQSVSQSGTIYVYAQSPFTPTCFDESSFLLTIVDTPVANSVPALVATTCDEDSVNDGVTSFDVATLTSAVLGSQTGPEFSVTWHESLQDANEGTNQVASSAQPTVYARVVNALAPNCYAVRAINLHVNKLPEPKPKSGIVCFDSETQMLISPYVLYSELSAATHTFQWLNEAGDVVGTGTSYVVNAPGDYTVIAANNATGCVSMPVTVTVTGSEPALITYSTTDSFSDDMSVTINASGTGDYEYQLDGGLWQDSNVFDNVASGTHTVVVRDKNRCGQSSEEVLIVNYPHYFTPNGDG
ncbi:MAG: adhesin, partial [Cytophagaceae bacterium]